MNNDGIGIDNEMNNELNDGNRNDGDSSPKEQEYFYRDFTVGDFEVTFNFKRMKSPMDIIDKLQQIHENESLSNDEKNKIVQKIINDYME